MKKSQPHKKLRLPKVGKPAVLSLPDGVRGRLSRRKASGPLEQLSQLPRITNDTVAEHREEVLASARKYIYPLQHSRGRIIKVSAALLIVAVVAFFSYCGLALYKFQSSSTFIYEVTRVIPFPVARTGSHFVSYESYLFELRHLTHYYETQQKEDFSSEASSNHLAKLKEDSLQKVIDDAYIKQLAARNNISVSNRAVSDQITMVKSQNRLGSSDQMLSDVLEQFWGWSIDDFRRELKSQMLSQKVASELDSAAHAKANNALADIRGGKDFAAVARKVSEDDTSKSRGGEYPAAISKNNRDVPPQVVNALFTLKPGQVSNIIETGYSLEIVKVLSHEGSKVKGAHISFRIKDISQYIKPLKEKNPAQHYIHI